MCQVFQDPHEPPPSSDYDPNCGFCQLVDAGMAKLLQPEEDAERASEEAKVRQEMWNDLDFETDADRQEEADRLTAAHEAHPRR